MLVRNSKYRDIARAGEEKGGGKGKKGYWSKELTGLKKQYLAKDWMAAPEYQQQMQSQVGKLFEPVTAPIGTTEQERQNIYNLQKTQTAGAQAGALDTAREGMSARGLGDSGFAQKAYGDIGIAGQRQLGETSARIAQNEVANRYQQAMDLNNLNLARTTAGGQMGKMAGELEQGQLGIGLQAGQFGMGMEEAANKARAAAAAASAAGSRWEQQFGAGQEQQSWENMMQLYGMGQQQQLPAYENYWQTQRQQMGDVY